MVKAKTNPFSAVEGTEPEEEGQELQLGGLGDAALAAIGEDSMDGALQEPLDGTDYLKVKFVGMSMDSLEDSIPLGAEMTFIVKARCIGEGTDISKQDGHKKRFVKMDVSSVIVDE